MGLSKIWHAALLASSISSSSAFSTINATLAPFPFPTDLCGINSWPTGQQGKFYTPQLPDSELTSILNQVDPVRIKAIIEKLASFGTRHTLSSQTSPERGIGAARDWLLEQYQGFAKESAGRMTVELQSYIQPVASRILFPTNISNIAATLRGSSDPERFVVVSGHYDSRATDANDYTSDAPGADDDASGVAISMELARIMAKHRPAATMIFLAVAGEEQGLYGSTYAAQLLANASKNVEGMWTNDIVGSPIGDDGKNSSRIIRLFAQGTPANESSRTAAQRLSVGGENDSLARQLGRFTRDVASNPITGMSVEVVYRLDRYLRGGDHRPFLEAGYAANRFTEPRENFAHQHQDVQEVNGTQLYGYSPSNGVLSIECLLTARSSSGDLPEYCDYYYISRVGKVTGAAMWSLANAPDTPKNVTVDTAALTNDSTLFWSKVKDAVKYEVVWRPTDEPFWTHYIEVGDVDAVTVKLSKDNVEFGVRSVGANGFRSPAVFPFPR